MRTRRLARTLLVAGATAVTGLATVGATPGTAQPAACVYGAAGILGQPTTTVALETGPDACPQLPPASENPCPPGLISERRDVTVPSVVTVDAMICVSGV